MSRHLTRLTKVIEGWSTKTDARQTGFSHYIKFTKKVDIMVSLKFANLMDNSLPWALALARKLLKADSELREAKRTIALVAECYDGDLRTGGHIYVPSEVWARVRANKEEE
jgi:hypothetical protein